MRIPLPIYQKHSYNCCSGIHTRLSTVVRQMPLIYYIVKWQKQFRVRRTWMCQSFAMWTIAKSRCLWRESEDIRFLFTSMRSVIRFFESKFLIILIILLAQNTCHPSDFTTCCVVLTTASQKADDVNKKSLKGGYIVKWWWHCL